MKTNMFTTMRHKLMILFSSASLAGLAQMTASAASSDARYDAVVSVDGSGSYTTIQAAIAAAPDNGSSGYTILVKPGTYQGQFMIPKTKRHLRIIGQEAEHTVLTWPYNVYDRTNVPTYQFDPGFVVTADDFYAENLTIENTSGDHGQALAVRVDADRAVFKGCRLLGWQDTLLLTTGRQYLTNCYIEGRVDFIYGSGTAIFDHCEIHSKNGGYITAANTPQDHPFGFVFLNCHLTGDPQPWQPNPGQHQFETSDVKTYLGRPWRPYASVAYLDCEMDGHIKAEGWDNWGNTDNEKTARYAEYQTTGAGADPEKRVKWARQLTADEAKGYTIENILGRPDGWKPLAGTQ